MTIALMIATFGIALPVALFFTLQLLVVIVTGDCGRRVSIVLMASAIAVGLLVLTATNRPQDARAATQPIITRSEAEAFPIPQHEEPNAALVIVGNDSDFSVNAQIAATAYQASELFRSLGYETAIVDAPSSEIAPTADWLGKTLVEWLGGRRNVIVYIVTHGYVDQLCLRCDAGQAISAQMLDSWLDRLDAERVTVIIEACHSGSFINDLAAPGRVVATSTDAVTKANAGEFKAYFSDALFTCLSANSDLMTCFDWARQNVPAGQYPQIWVGWED